jgi:hypothetical protein
MVNYGQDSSRGWIQKQVENACKSYTPLWYIVFKDGNISLANDNFSPICIDDIQSLGICGLVYKDQPPGQFYPEIWIELTDLPGERRLSK